MSFFKGIEKLFGSIIRGIKSILSDPDAAIERATKLAKIPSDLLAFALPVAKAFSSLTPGTSDDLLVAAAERMNMGLQDILNDPDKVSKKGKILTLIGNGIKIQIEKSLAGLGGQKLKIGNINIRIPDDIATISGDFFDLAAQSAYTLFIKARDPNQINEPDIEPTALLETKES